MRHIAFFDIDGTLCNSSGQVLPSTVDCIRAFRQSGHLAFICTGRSKPEIVDEILDVGFDGIIGAGGGYIEIDHRVVMHKTLEPQFVEAILSYFQQQDIGYYLETNEGLFGSKNCVPNIHTSMRKIAEQTGQSYDALAQKMAWFEELLLEHQQDGLETTSVNKISFINNTVPFNAIAERFGEQCAMYRSTVALFGAESGEIAVKGVDKRSAIEFILAQLQMDKQQTIAFGDGDNDIAMFEAVKYRVAMANATDNLKAIADEITADADNDGIAQSFQKNGWI